MRRPYLVRLGLAVIALGGLLAYLRDPAWLMQVESGFRGWEVADDGTRYRWTGGHASFFVPAAQPRLSIPLRTTFSSAADLPVTVTLFIDDRPAQRIGLTDGQWHLATLDLPPRGWRHLRRIDIRVDRLRPGNRGVAVGF